jgi:acyl carrier protein
MTLRTAIKTFILQNYLFTDDESALGDADSLLEKGIVDSTGILELVAHLEEEHGVQVLDEEMLPANLDSVDSIVAFVQRKNAA